MAWAQFFEHGNRRVRLTNVHRYQISTVFLGNNHRIDDGPPLIFETMVFGGDETYFFAGKNRRNRQSIDGVRTSTYAEAVEAHKRLVRLYRMSKRQLKRREEYEAMELLRNLHRLGELKHA